MAALPTNVDTREASRVPEHFNDQSWKVLQRKHVWRFVPLGEQRPGFSDIEQAEKDYRVGHGEVVRQLKN